MEENMQAVGSILGNLKSMAQDMNQEIDKQNTQIDRIEAKVRFYFSSFHFFERFSFIFIIALCLFVDFSISFTFLLEPTCGCEDRRSQQTNGKVVKVKDRQK